jgi:hypothetical protein
MNTKPSTILLTPAQVAKALLWINEAQAHVNSCSGDFDGDPESLDTAIELQRLIDAEWDKLGLLVEGRARPYSVLRARLESESTIAI